MHRHNAFLLLLATILLAASHVHGQNIKYKIKGDQLRGGVCGDCFLCGGPDNNWELQLRDNGTSTGWSAWNKYAGDDDCGWRNYSNSGWRGFTNSTYGRSVEVQLRAYEDDGGGWGGGNDGNCGSMATVSNPVITATSPCAWTQYEGTRTCSGALWGVRYSVYWEYNEAPTLSGQTPANQVKCSTVNATALNITSNTDGGGRVMARWYKWQISNTPNGPWSDIPSGANTVLNASTTIAYTPYRISGTRYYQVLTTSNCSSDFSSLTTTSPVYTVTYAFVSTGAYTTAPVSYPFGTGDATPAIQSPICGAQIASSQLVTLNTIQSPTPGHVANATYSWSATGGSPTTGTASSLGWTSPVTLGAQTISLTYNFGSCPSPATVTCATTVSDPSCEFIYVAPLASGGANTATAGGPSNPCLTLTGTNGALARAAATGAKHIKMLNGAYAEQVIVDLTAGLTIEGGYSKPGTTWVKGSNSTTNITCSGTGNGTVSSTTQHIMGFRSTNVGSWRLIDLNITTDPASTTTSSGYGLSNYAVYISGASSSGYEISRCKITSGNASNGTVGSNGSAGSNGTKGLYGSGGNDGCGNDGGGNGGGGGPGGAGGAGASAGATGGAGAAGGRGASDNGSNCCTGNTGGSTSCASGSAGSGSSSSTNDGTGLTGGACNTPGASGTDGNTIGSTFTSGYYVPSYGTNGGGGSGGTGGGGGGGGGRNTDGGCDASGNGGSGGGGGGGGGGGAWGAQGGGSSFGVFLWNNTNPGSIINSQISTGSAGALRAGATGGAGGAGGAGGDRQTGCSGCGRVNKGGAGGSGSAGGQGGDGAAADAGIRYAIAVQGTSNSPGLTNITPAITVNSSTSGGAVSTSPAISITYNDNMKLCKNSVLTIARTSGTGNWTLPATNNFDYVKYNQTATASQYAAGNVTPSDIYPTNNTAGYYDLQSGTLVFDSYLDLESDNRTAPSVTVKATDGSALSSNSICAGGSVLLNKTGSFGTVVDYRWEVFSGATAPNKSAFPSGTAVFSSNVSSPEFGPFNIAATYTVRYQEREQCCGWSIPVFATITVKPDPSAPTNITFSSPATGAAICVPLTITVSGASGGTNGITPYTYEYVYDNGAGFGSFSGTLPSFASQEGDNTIKVRIKEVALWGCDASAEYQEVITGNPVPVGQANPASQEICSGQTADVSFVTTNTVAGTTFAWSRTNTTNVTGLAASGSGDISAALSLASGVTTAQTVIFTITPTGPATTLCGGSSFTADVIVNPNPTVSPTNNGPICEGYTLTLTGGAGAGTPGYTYDWTGPSAYAASGSPVNRTSSTAAMAGTYTVTVTDSKGCTATNNTVASVVLDPTYSSEPSGSNTICAGQSYNTAVTVNNGTGIGYQWQYSTDGTNWFSVGLNAPVNGFSYVGAIAANLTINTTTSVAMSNQYRFRCYVSSGNGCDPNPLISTSVTLNVVPATINASHRTWTGMVSNDWLNALNWDCGGVPTDAIDVIIPQAPRYPIITTGQFAECNTIKINENGPPSTIIVEIQNGGNLKVDSP